jgi:hypothetical protein
VAGSCGFLFSWCYGPKIGGKTGLSPLAATTFDLHGVAFSAWALVAFAIGVVAGILIRRVVPAMFATIVAWSGLAVVDVAAGLPVLAIPMDRGRLAARAFPAPHGSGRLAGPPSRAVNSRTQRTRRLCRGQSGRSWTSYCLNLGR